MIGYLIKSCLCLIILLLVYHAFLEREKMHRFNRYFLLFGLVFSFTIPLLTFEIGTEAVSVLQLTNRIEILSSPAVNYSQAPIIKNEPTTSQSTTSVIPFLFLGYLLVSSIMTVRLFHNLYLLFLKIKNNPHVSRKKNTLILVENCRVPHSFFNYIFVDKKLFQTGTIDEAVFKHEQTHARQKHSVDILLIELLKIVFWFNPVLYFYKKAMQLNHEYLADDSVISGSADVRNYQKLLLKLQSSRENMQLSSSIHYSITRKRIMMMTKNTTRLRTAAKQIALIPLLAALVFAFSIRTAPAQQIQSMTLTELIDALNKKIESTDSLSAEERETLSNLVVTMRKKLHKPPTPPTPNQEPEAAREIRQRFPFILKAPPPSSPTDSVAIARISKRYNNSVQAYLDIKPIEENVENLKAAYKQIQSAIDRYADLYMEIYKKYENNPPPPPPFPMPSEPKERRDAYFFRFASPPKPPAPTPLPKPTSPTQMEITQLDSLNNLYEQAIKAYVEITPVKENLEKLKAAYAKVVEINKKMDQLQDEVYGKDLPAPPIFISPAKRIKAHTFINY